jgi:hypothetical protein
VNAANKDSSNWQEELQLRKGEQRVKMSGHRLKPEGAQIPLSIDSFEYTGLVRDTGRDHKETPVTDVAISFDNYKRFIFVEGQSPEQVDAVISVLRDDFAKLSSPFGDLGVNPFLMSGSGTSSATPPRGTNYERTVELPPIRVSFEDLQAMLDQVSTLVNAANKGSSNWQDELQLRKGEQLIKMSGHRLEAGGGKIPASIDSFEYTGRVQYTGRDSEEAPITHMTISFYDYKRSISIEGRSPEQVDAVISALRDDLSKLSVPFGNIGRIFLTWPGRLFGPLWLLSSVLYYS